MFYDFFKVDAACSGFSPHENAVPSRARNAPSEVVSSIGRLALAPSFWSFFAFCRDSIKECQLVGGEDRGLQLKKPSRPPHPTAPKKSGGTRSRPRRMRLAQRRRLGAAL